MALDFHLSKNRNDAERTSPLVSMEFVIHVTIFDRGVFKKGRYPLFNRINHFFKDASYTTNELEELVNEIKEVKTLFPFNLTVLEKLDHLLSVIKQAQDTNLNIWVFCD